jgi:serine/threonine protein kinase
MGVVYRGVDTRLDRPVAIKISKEQFSSRFEREAIAISSLNHPNICTLYDIGPNYLVMEFIAGESLANALARGPLARKCRCAMRNSAHERFVGSARQRDHSPRSKAAEHYAGAWRGRARRKIA